MEKLKGLVTRQRAFDVQLLDSFAAASLQELDYLNEAANQVPFNLIVSQIFVCGQRPSRSSNY